MGAAQAEVISIRGTSDKKSRSLLLRDAERYLWGRFGKVSLKGQYSPETMDYLASWIGDFYNLTKFVLSYSHFERFIRSTSHPSSSVGGDAWFQKGLEDYEDYDKGNLDKDQFPESYADSLADDLSDKRTRVLK